MTNVPQISALAAARLILEQAATPLHYEEITKRILANGLWHTNGKTPAATVNAHIAVDIKRKGTASAFVRTAPGLYALNQTPAEARRSRGEKQTPDLFSSPAPPSFTIPIASPRPGIVPPESIRLHDAGWPQ